MQHTTWIDRCAEVLRTREEMSTDVQLTEYIGIQSLSHQSRLLLDEERRGPRHASIANWEQIIATAEKYQARTKDTMSSRNENSDCKLISPLVMDLANS